MSTVNLRLVLDSEAPMEEYLMDGIITEFFPQDNGTNDVIIKDVDELLIDSMNSDDLVGFLGIDTEFLIAIQVLEFA